MGGGGGSGTISTIDLSQLTKAAEERLKQISVAKGGVLFACETSDLKTLTSHLKRSEVFKSTKHSVLTGEQSASVSKDISNQSVVVIFTANTTVTDFLDKVAEETLLQKKQCIHARAEANSVIPSKVMAYRWPSLLWEEVEALFSE